MDELSDTKIRNATPADKEYAIADGQGLSVVVRPNGTKLWLYRYRFGGKRKNLSFGTFPGVGLKAAREKRHNAEKLLDQGQDPVAVRAAKRQEDEKLKHTFRTVGEEWATTKFEKENKAKSTIKRALPQKFSGGTTAPQAILTSLQHCAGRSTVIAPSTPLAMTMRKPRDFDAELKAPGDKARDLKSRKVQQLGELVIATGVDTLSADELAGALIVPGETKEAGKREAWARRGAAFFQSRARRIAPKSDRNPNGPPSQQSGAQPASSRMGAT